MTDIYQWYISLIYHWCISLPTKAYTVHNVGYGSCFHLIESPFKVHEQVQHINTRKPCYHNDNCAMRPIYGCPEKFRESSQTPPATFPEICKVLLFRSILRMCIQNLKFVALSFPEIIGGTQKIWAVPRYAHAPFSLKFLKGFCSDGPCEYICQIWSS